MRRRETTIALLAAALLAFGCGGDTGAAGEAEETAAAEAAELSPEELGEIGAALRAEPERADEILAERGLEWEELEAAVREVATDVDASRRYSEALLGGAELGAESSG